MIKYTYMITSVMSVVDWHQLIKATFSAYDGQPASFNGNGVITVTFDSPQTPSDLGPLIKVELISE